MSQYNIFKAIPMSFYSKRLYQDVAVNWGGKAFLYLLFLIALTWVFHTILLQSAVTKNFNLYGDEFFNQVPTLTVKDGKLSTPENRPYMIKNPFSKEDFILIDTTGQTTALSQTKAKMLVTQTEVITETKPNEVRTDEIPTNVNAVIEPMQVKEYIANYIHYLWIPLFAFAVLGVYILRILQALIYGIFGKIFASINNVLLSYSQAVQIAMVAVTPAIIIRTILDIFGIILPYENLIFFILAMLYIIFGVNANKVKGIT